MKLVNNGIWFALGLWVNLQSACFAHPKAWIQPLELTIFFFFKKRWAWCCIWTHVLKRQRQAELWTYLPVYLPYVLISKPMRHSKKEKNAESKEKKEKEKKKDRGHPKYGNIVLLSSTCKNNCNTHVSANTWTCLFMFTDPQDCSSKLKQGCVLWP